MSLSGKDFFPEFPIQGSLAMRLWELLKKQERVFPPGSLEIPSVSDGMEVIVLSAMPAEVAILSSAQTPG
jgi:hypothetical protein